MSTLPRSIDLALAGKARSIDGFSVARVLPSVQKRMVGPFIFFDRMGPEVVAANKQVQVRPHPHINLSTVTYLFEGAMDHRDSLGTFQTIHAGDVNLMTAGKGIVHSERTPQDIVGVGQRMYGLQLWMAMPQAFEEQDPSFVHAPQASLPIVSEGGFQAKILLGEAFGAKSPATTLHPNFYVDASLQKGSSFLLPSDEERSLYLLDGSLECDGLTLEKEVLYVFAPNQEVKISAPQSNARFMLLGGAPMDGPRFIEWNFVSSRKERIEQAKDDWKSKRFPLVPGDEVDFIPLPE